MKLRIADGRAHVDLDDPALRLTGPQKRALELGREIVVTAGAGAGKTHTLALRFAVLYLELAHRGMPEIDAVAVLTFTEKAAAEMTERCYARMVALATAVRSRRGELDALEGPEGRPLGGHLCAALDRLCDRFDGARIGTFHGFCAGVLREFPVASRTPLDTLVLEPVEAAAARREALDDGLIEALRADATGITGVLDAFGSRVSLVQAGAQALDRLGELEGALERHATGPVPIETRIAAAPWTSERAAAWLDGARANLGALARLLTLGGSPWLADQLRPTLASLAEPPDLAPSELALWRFGAVRRALQLVLNDRDELRTLTHHSVMGLKAHWPDAGRHRQARAALGVLAERLADWPALAPAARELPTHADAVLLEALQPFARWVLDAAERYRAWLSAQRALDFGEMQQRAVRAVLEDPDVRAALVRRHRYLVVDEFQDTDARQWALVRALGRPEGVPADRIFLVGDAKQAIYGFRGGDVTVFRRATAELEVQPLVLPHNFRSRTELIEWFNRVFPAVLAPRGAPHAPHEAPYDPLVAGRGQSGGSVTVVLGDPDGAPDSEATAHLVAAEVLAGRGAYSNLDLASRAAHPAPPIAILLRRRTHMSAYEEALRRRGVPYAVARGVGFWSRPEVVDLVNALHGLATGDPLSVVGALRSPLFHVDDQLLTDLGPQALARFGRGPCPHPRVSGAWTRWAALRRRCRTERASIVLRRLVQHARTAWHEGPDLGPGRREQNATRLVALAESTDARLGLHGTAEHFLEQVLAGTRESEVALAPDKARVILMTVHAAKGLEFPVVLVPEIDVPPRPNTAPLSVGRPDAPSRWELAFRVEDEQAEVQRRVRPGLLEAIHRASRAEEDAEQMRLLYVAATRARDHLVLLGNRPPERAGARPTWVARLADQLPASTRVLDRDELLTWDLPASAPSPAPALPPAPEPNPARTRAIELGASSLDAFTACPARWYRRTLLGLPEHGPRREERARELAGLRGQVLHGLLEDDAADNPALAERRWRAAVFDAGFAEAEVSDGLPILLRHLDIARDSAMLTAAQAAEGHAELGFRAQRGAVVLRGQIDRLYLAPEGWTVLDYKTEALRGSAVLQAQRHRRQLLAYAWAADGILRRHGTSGVARAEVFFTATGDRVPLAWDDAARAEIESLLDDVGRVAELSWDEVARASVDLATERPCATCGFRGRGCVGQSLSEVEP